MSLTCYRSIVFSDMPLGMHETFLRLRSDHLMIREVTGLVVVNQDATWGYSGGETYGQGLIENGMPGIQAVVDRLTSRSTRIDHPEYELDDNTHCLLVTTSDSDAYSIRHLVEVMEKTMPEHTRCDWLHIEWGEGMAFSDAEALINAWNGGEFDRNCIRNRTASEKVEYGHREWSAAVIQYLESRMLEREGAISFDEEVRSPRTFGFATLDFSQTEGRRFLEAKAFLQVVERENERVDLDLVFRRCSEALKGGDRLLAEALSHADAPLDLGKLVTTTEDYARFDVRQRLSDFRDRVTNNEGTIEKVEQSVEEGIEHLKAQIETILESSDSSAQERLSIIQSLLGHVPERTHGKPLRTTMMLDDCERDCLAELAALSEFVEDAPSVQELHIQRRFCAEQMDNIVNLKRAIEIDEEAGLDTSSEKQQLLRLRQEFEKCQDGYDQLRQRYTRFRRGMFAALSTQWMEGLFERLVKEATYDYKPPVVVEKPLLGPWEKRVLITTGAILPLWLWLAWKIGIGFWFEQVLLTVVYAIGWAVVISLRLRKPKKVQENPMVKQREMWMAAADKYHGAMVRFAALSRFQKLFDEEVHKPLILEYNRLTSLLGNLRSQADEAREVVENSFTEVDFVQHIGNADSFNKYYEYDLSPSMGAVPSIVKVYLEFMSSKRRHWTEEDALEEYRRMIRKEVNDHLESLERFEMLEYLMEREHNKPPHFVDPDLPPLGELIRRAKISLGGLHDCAKEEDGHLTVFIGRSDNTTMTDRFRQQINSLFPESRQARLDFVLTDDVNRIGFLRMIDVDVRAMKAREQQDARRVRRRKPAPDVPKAPAEEGEGNVAPPPPAPTPDGGGHAFGTVGDGRLTFILRGDEVSFDLPSFTELERQAILDLEHFERGVRLIPGQDVEEVVYSRILGHSEHDGELEKLMEQARNWASRLGISLPEVLIALVQAIPYEVGTHEKYPIETLMEGHGDCSDKSTLLKKMLGMCGVNSALLLYEDLKHMALGMAVPKGSGGHMVEGFAFMECTAPFVVGNDPVPLVSGRTPKGARVECLLSDPSLGPWSGYSAYREAAAQGFPPTGKGQDTPIRNMNPRADEGNEDARLRNKWKEQP